MQARPGEERAEKMIKSTIIGCGARAIEHAASYKNIPEAAIWAICDSNLERLRAFPGAIPAERRFSDIESLLANFTPDLVHLVTPPTVRLAIITRLVSAGTKAFIIEKPLACSLAEAQQIVTLCRQHGALLVVNHQLPLMGSYRRAKQFLEEGAIGAVERVRVSCNGSPYEQGTHMLDLASFFLGGIRPQRMLGQMAGAGKLTAAHPSPEWMLGRILFEGGAAVDLVFGDIADPRVDPAHFWVGCRVEIVGAKGVIDHKLSHGYRIITEDMPVIVDAAFNYGEENAQAQLDLTRRAIAAVSAADRVAAGNGDAALLPIALLEGLIASASQNAIVDYPVAPIPDLRRRLEERLAQ